MGLFDFLFGRPDVARTWRERAGLELVLNLDRHTFCELKLGDRADRISMLGAPDGKRATKEETYLYSAKGVELCTGEAGIDTITVIFEPEGHYLLLDAKAAAPFGGKVIHGGKLVALSRETSVEDFVGRFGEPYWRDVDEDESTLFYEFGALEWQVEFGETGRLTSLVIIRPPLMADPVQRSAFQVDKAWPPG